MGLRDLLTVLEEEGAAEYEKSQQHRRAEAARIIADARERALKIHHEAVAAAETEAGREAETLLIAARFGVRRATRTARDDALAEVFDLVRERLLRLPGSPTGATAVVACVDEALQALPRASMLCVHPDDVATIGTAAGVTVVADPAVVGAIAEDDEGRYVDNTYLTRLTSRWGELRVGLSREWDLDS